MDPNGNIIEETQYVPNQTRSPEHIMNQIDNILALCETIQEKTGKEALDAFNEAMENIMSEG